MNRSDSPKKQPKPFGVNGQRVAILPTTPAGDNSASYEQGFPPITMILKSAGGLPPKGQDMNQILYELSALGRWSSTGALNTFDSEFASEISGYPSGAMLISDDGERIFINTTEGNLSDPNSNGAGWKDILSYLGLGEAANGVSVVGSSRNARINIIAPSATATFTADEIVVETALGGKYYRLAAFNKAVNLAVNGAGGLDTGAVPSSGYVALYAIYNPTTSTSALLAVNATSTVAPEVYGGGNMPAGFTASALVSVWRVASGQFVTGIQRGRRITFSPFLVMASSISAASYTSLDISSCVPRNAQSIDGNANPNITGTGYNTNISVASLSDGTGSVSIGCGGAAVTAPFSGIQIATPQTIYYTLTASAPLQTSFISITGYEI